jgi:hypothetical protein
MEGSSTAIRKEVRILEQKNEKLKQSMLAQQKTNRILNGEIISPSPIRVGSPNGSPINSASKMRGGHESSDSWDQ